MDDISRFIGPVETPTKAPSTIRPVDETPEAKKRDESAASTGDDASRQSEDVGKTKSKVPKFLRNLKKSTRTKDADKRGHVGAIFDTATGSEPAPSGSRSREPSRFLGSRRKSAMMDPSAGETEAADSGEKEKRSTSRSWFGLGGESSDKRSTSRGWWTRSTTPTPADLIKPRPTDPEATRAEATRTEATRTEPSRSASRSLLDIASRTGGRPGDREGARPRTTATTSTDHTSARPPPATPPPEHELPDDDDKTPRPGDHAKDSGTDGKS